MSKVPSNQPIPNIPAAPVPAFSSPEAATAHVSAWMTILNDFLIGMQKAAPIVIPMLGNANTRSEVATGVEITEVAGAIVEGAGK